MATTKRKSAVYVGRDPIHPELSRTLQAHATLHQVTSPEEATAARAHYGPFDIIAIGDDLPPGDRSRWIHILTDAAPATSPAASASPEDDGHSSTTTPAASSAAGAATSADRTSPLVGEATSPNATPLQLTDEHEHRVLIIDDDPASSRQLACFLQKRGYQVSAARSATDGLRHLLDQGADIVVAEWNMADTDAAQLCQAIRANETVGFVYIMITSVRADKRQLVEAFEAGADDFLTKPIDRQELLVRLRAGSRIVDLEQDLARRTRDIYKTNAEMAMLNERLEQLATTDGLTGLNNRREAMIKLRDLWTIAARYDVPFACIVFDIDRFKSFNDTHGHAMGDRVLAAIARVARDAVRSADIVGRVGGEEFLIICPNTDAQGAAALAERIRANVQNGDVQCDGKSVNATVSLGVAERSAEHREPDDLVKAADLALYEAKAAGRNRVSVAKLSPTPA